MPRKMDMPVCQKISVCTSEAGAAALTTHSQKLGHRLGVFRSQTRPPIPEFVGVFLPLPCQFVLCLAHRLAIHLVFVARLEARATVAAALALLRSPLRTGLGFGLPLGAPLAPGLMRQRLSQTENGLLLRSAVPRVRFAVVVVDPLGLVVARRAFIAFC